MTTDSYYAIGKSHTVCQDVARHGGDRSPFIIVCDGCSGSPQTELGAAVLAQTISTLLQPPILSAHRRVQAFGPPAIFAAAYSCDSLRVPRAALDATLMLAIQTDTHVQAAIWGDGAYPRVLVAGVLSQIRANMLAGHIGPTVATMHTVHVLTHLTGVDASR